MFTLLQIRNRVMFSFKQMMEFNRIGTLPDDNKKVVQDADPMMENKKCDSNQNQANRIDSGVIVEKSNVSNMNIQKLSKMPKFVTPNASKSSISVLKLDDANILRQLYAFKPKIKKTSTSKSVKNKNKFQPPLSSGIRKGLVNCITDEVRAFL